MMRGCTIRACTETITDLRVITMLKIGEFSKLSRISIRMLRHYDEIGLLTPDSIDPFTGYRYYSEDQLLAAGRIAALRDMGFGLSAIGEILACGADREALEGHLLRHRAELTALAEQTGRQLQLLDTALERLRKEEAMEYEVTLKSLPQRQVASVRMTLPSYEREGDLWSTLISETAPLGVRDTDPRLLTVTYYDVEYRETDIDAEAQKTVTAPFPDTEHVRCKTVPAVTFAAVTYRGPYSGIGEANAAVAAWVRDNGYAYDGPAFNIYHVAPPDTTDPARFVTEVCYPVRKA